MLYMLKKIKIENNIIIIKKINTLYFIGLTGSLELKINKNLNLNINNNNLILESVNKKLLNLFYSLILKKKKGINQKLKLSLILKGIGYKVKKVNQFLIFKLGYSHPIILLIPKNIKIQILKSTIIILYSNNWEFLTKFVYLIKKLRKTDPYKGKGILLKNEIIIKKEGKKK